MDEFALETKPDQGTLITMVRPLVLGLDAEPGDAVQDLEAIHRVGEARRTTSGEALPRLADRTFLPDRRLPKRLENVSDLSHPVDEAPEQPGASVVKQSLSWIAGGLIVVYGGFLLLDAQYLARPLVRWVLACDALVISVSATLLLLLQRRLSLTACHLLATVVVVVLQCGILVSVVAYDNVTYLGTVPLLLIGAGAVVVSARWLVTQVLLVIGSTIPMIWICRLTQEQVALDAQPLVAATMIAGVVYFSRRRGDRRIQELRRRDAAHTLQLRAALARVEQELTERQRAEAQRTELEEQLRQAQKLEALGVLAGGVAHDMNNVLAAISAIVSAARDEVKDRVLRRDLQQVLAATRRGSALTQNLLGFARKGKQRTELVHVNQLVDEVVQLLARTLPKQVALTTELDPRLDDVMGDAGQLSHVLMNLCLNAADAVGSEGTIGIRTENVVLEETEVKATLAGLQPGRHVRLTVRDNGVGMSPEVMARAFEPFFSSKRQGGRSGLGLSMVYGTVTEHGGKVRLESAPGAGATVSVLLPSRPAVRAVIDSAPEAPVATGAEPLRVVLLVDDEPLLRAAGRRLLTSVGYKVMLARHGGEAVELFREHHERIDLVVLDMAMPVMSGAECFRRLREISFVPVLIASGFAKGENVDALLGEHSVKYLGKPFEKEAFSAALADLLAPESHGRNETRHGAA